MAQLQHLVNHESLTALKDGKRLMGNPMEMNKRLFVTHLEAQADNLYDQFIEDGHDPAVAFVLTQDRLTELTKQWKEARPL